MTEPTGNGFAMAGGWQDELDFGDLPDPYEDLEPDDEEDGWGSEDEEPLKDCE